MATTHRQTKRKGDRMDDLTHIISDVVSEAVGDEETASEVMKKLQKKRTAINRILQKAGGVQRRKDPNAPTKPRSAYIMFCVEHRPKIAKEHTDQKEVMVALGQAWKSLSDRERHRYEKKAQEDRRRYEEQMKTYTPPEGEEFGPTRRKREGPKRPQTAYLFFCNDKRGSVVKKNPELQGRDVTRHLAQMWKETKDKDRTKYNKLAEADRERYQHEKAALEGDNTPTTETRARPTREKTHKSSKHTGKSKGKSKVSVDTAGFEAFTRHEFADIQEEHPKWNTKKVAEECRRRWRALTDEDRQTYENDAREDEEDLQEEEDDE